MDLKKGAPSAPRLFANPTTGVLNLAVLGGYRHLTVMDPLGRKGYESDVQGEIAVLELNGKGVHFVRCEGKAGQTTQRVMVR